MSDRIDALAAKMGMTERELLAAIVAFRQQELRNLALEISNLADQYDPIREALVDANVDVDVVVAYIDEIEELNTQLMANQNNPEMILQLADQIRQATGRAKAAIDPNQETPELPGGLENPEVDADGNPVETSPEDTAGG